MNRREELLKIFEGKKDLLTVVTPLIDEIIFVEEQLTEVKKMPLIKSHPNNPTFQKITPAGRMYKDLLSQERESVRLLCSLIHKTEVEGDGDSLLRLYFKNKMETRG